MPDSNRATLYAANLEMAWMTKTRFTGSNLRDADLQEAKLNNANLENADLRGAKLRFATFQNTWMEGCTGCPHDWMTPKHPIEVTSHITERPLQPSSGAAAIITSESSLPGQV